jgi:hypothetical protein
LVLLHNVKNNGVPEEWKRYNLSPKSNISHISGCYLTEEMEFYLEIPNRHYRSGRSQRLEKEEMHKLTLPNVKTTIETLLQQFTPFPQSITLLTVSYFTLKMVLIENK